MEIFLETDRLVLRRFTEADLDHLTGLDSDPEVMRHLGDGCPTPPERIEREVLPRFVGRPDQFWAAVEKDSTAFLGWFALSVPPGGDGRERELGYRLRRATWGRGYATEGARELLRAAFTRLGAERVYAQTMAVNTASRRVMEKAGLRYLRTFHEEWEHPLPGAEHGEVEYELRRADWQRSDGTATAATPGSRRRSPAGG